jgi:hypothetical protein
VSARKCPQCGQLRRYPDEFTGARGKPIRWCLKCRANYRGWNKKTAEEKAAIPRLGVPVDEGGLRVTFVRHSKNSKLGDIPSSWSSRNTCPPSCGFYEAGCYALYGKLAFHWRNVPRDGLSWEDFCSAVAALPDGQLWRHNVAGDLPGVGDALDFDLLRELVEANNGRRGFTFAHKTSEANFEALQWVNLEGFTINLSADSLEAADALFQRGSELTRAGPVVVVVPSGAPDKMRTPSGRRVIVCPAESQGLTCLECQLCANPHRRTIIAFRAHGQSKRLASELVRSRRTEAA